jgi:ABC-type dipeptide/oligopeptide/nickel transport system permease subunit
LFACPALPQPKEPPMNQIIYIVGAVVIVIAVLSFFGLR